MKLRFRNNSVRLRLNRREAEDLASGSVLEQQIAFPEGSTFSYILEATADSHGKASFQQGVIRIGAPVRDLKDWAAGAAIGIYFELPVQDSVLKIAIEKDLECIEGAPEERDPDAFPRAACKNC